MTIQQDTIADLVTLPNFLIPYHFQHPRPIYQETPIPASLIN